MKDILLNVIDWNDKEINDDDMSDESTSETDLEYIIEAYGRTQDDKSVYLRVNGFTPHFYVEIPKEWKDTQVKKFANYIKEAVYPKHYKEGLLECKSLKRQKLYGFRAGKKYKFVRLVFRNVTCMKKFQYLFYKKHKIYGLDNNLRMYNMYETNIPPLLRFLHIQDINASGWIEIKSGKFKKLEEKNNTDISIEAKWVDIKPPEDEELNGNISDLKILSFDIECTSGDGSFPQPNRIEDKIIQIGSTFSRNGSEECYFKHIITLGSCDKIEGAEVESYDTEEEVLLAWKDLLIREDPDILTGYNIFGFDEHYIHDRAKLFGIENEFGVLSRIRDKICKFNELKLSSSALGDNKMKYYDMPGRVQIDLMKVVQRDYKLSSYKLDSVAENFLTSKVVKCIDARNIEVDQAKDLSSGNFIKLIDPNGDAINDSEKYKVENIDGSIVTVDKDIDVNVVKWALAKDDVSPNDIFRLQKGTSKDRKIIAEYCIQDCALVNKLMSRLCIVTNSIGMSNVCNIPLSYLFFRGQGIKIFSLVAKECRSEHFLVPVVKKNIEQDGEERIGYEGATVFKPNIGFYKRPIAVNDYSSLYPSCIIHKNLSHETFVDDPEYDNHPDYIYYDAEFNNSDGTKLNVGLLKIRMGVWV